MEKEAWHKISFIALPVVALSLILSALFLPQYCSPPPPQKTEENFTSFPMEENVVKFETSSAPYIPEKKKIPAISKQKNPREEDEKNEPSLLGITILSSGWGKDPGQFGISLDGPRPGPMSFLLDKDGNSWILDQENYRVQIFDKDGKFVRSLPLSSNSYEIMAMNSSNSELALYNYEKHKIEILNSSGTNLREYELPSDLVPITEVWSRGDKIYVEASHDGVYEFTSSSPTPRSLPGRPLSEGKYLKLSRKDGDSVEIICYQEDSGTSSFPVLWQKSIPMVSSELTAFQTDSSGNIYIGWRHYVERMEQNEPKVVIDEQKMLKLDSEGNQVADIKISNEYFSDFRRSIYVAPDGTVYQMTSTSEKFRLAKFTVR